MNALKSHEDLDGQLEIVGVPCNQFGLQEPAENFELLNGVKYVRPGDGFVPDFLMAAKTEVNGANEHPLYTFLKDKCPAVKSEIGDPTYLYWKPIKNGDITWNFSKFLIYPGGRPYKRYDPDITPLQLIEDVKTVLADVAEDQNEQLTVKNQFKRLLDEFQDN